MSGTRLPWLLFVLSLVVNLAFVAGVGYTVYEERRAAGSPEARADIVAERLGLNAAQTEALVYLRERAAVRWPGLREAGQESRDAILARAAEPQFDRDEVMALLEARDTERRAYYAEYAEDLHGFLVTLTPEQRSQFLEMAQERGFLRQVYSDPTRRREWNNSGDQ